MVPSYLDVGHGKELWFSFFESRGNPSEDPVIMWINGGPGCSSAMGMLMELGPCTINDDPKTVNDTKRNPYSWNEHANIFFLNVGYSYARHGQNVATAEEAGLDVAAFVSIVSSWARCCAHTTVLRHLQGVPWPCVPHGWRVVRCTYTYSADAVIDESDAQGRYIPVFASAIYDNNRALVKAGKEPINLQSVMIGVSRQVKTPPFPLVSTDRLRTALLIPVS
jgi:cathepsin A (carboxypeptidase C)